MVKQRKTVGVVRSENAQLWKENAILEGEVTRLRQTVSALCTLQELTMTIDVHTDVWKLLQQIMILSLDVIGAGAGSLLLVDEATDELGFAVVIGGASKDLVGYRMPKDAGIAGWVASHGEPLIVPNVRQDIRFLGLIDELFKFQTRSMICVPIVNDYHILGVIEILNKRDGKEFNEQDLNLMSVVGQVAGSAIVRLERALKGQTDTSHIQG
jgi:GAF domain-containing protein